MKLCTRSGCQGTAAAFPKLSFRDAAGNQSSALLRLAVCSEHMGADFATYLGAVSWPAVQAAHEGRYGLAPIYSETVLSYVLVSSIEGQTYLAALEDVDNKKELLRQMQPHQRVIPVEEVSREEFERLLAEGNRNRS